MVPEARAPVFLRSARVPRRAAREKRCIAPDSIGATEILVGAATLGMSAFLAGLAYAAAPDGRSTEDSSVDLHVLPCH